VPSSSPDVLSATRLGDVALPGSPRGDGTGYASRFRAGSITATDCMRCHCFARVSAVDRDGGLKSEMTKRSLRSDIDAVASLREPTRRALYQFVVRQPAPVSRDQAAEALGLSRPMAAFHLDRLVATGLLIADYRRLSGRSGPGAGRPAKLYHRSRRRVDISLPERDHNLLAGLLAAAIAQSGPNPIAEEPARELGRSLGSRARSRLRSGVVSAPRLAGCVGDVLETIGFEPYRTSSGELRARNCPFDPLSRRFEPVVCGVGQALVGGVLEGIGVDHLGVTREYRSGSCCVVVGKLDRTNAVIARPPAG
jgi:predicted ArsR family transcriptional regulator